MIWQHLSGKLQLVAIRYETLRENADKNFWKNRYAKAQGDNQEIQQQENSAGVETHSLWGIFLLYFRENWDKNLRESAFGKKTPK